MEVNGFSEFVKGYVGGQMNISRGYHSNNLDCKRYCGTIESVAIEGNKLKVKLAWNATLVFLEKDKERTRWVSCDELDYVFELSKYEMSLDYWHGEGRVLSLEEGCSLTFRPDEEMISFRGPGVKGRLNPLKVRGLGR